MQFSYKNFFEKKHESRIFWTLSIIDGVSMIRKSRQGQIFSFSINFKKIFKIIRIHENMSILFLQALKGVSKSSGLMKKNQNYI